MRMTAQRKAILDALRKLKTHPTADELYEVLKKQIPRISLATVYRNLELLSDAGLIKRLDPGADRKRRYDANVEPHFHVRCTVCGRIGDVKISSDFNVHEVITDTDNFVVEGYSIDFWGLCEKCAGKMSKEGG